MKQQQLPQDMMDLLSKLPDLLKKVGSKPSKAGPEPASAEGEAVDEGDCQQCDGEGCPACADEDEKEAASQLLIVVISPEKASE